MSSIILLFSFLINTHFVHAHAGVQASAPWIACELKKKDEPCEYRDHHLDIYRGTCQEAAGKLICIRNKSIIKEKEK